MTDAVLPHHVAMIMDGNGRWAKKRFLPRLAGHQAGRSTLKKIVNYAAAQGIKVLSVFAFSTENWQRPEEEVQGLLDLFVKSLDTEVPALHENQIRLRILGDLSRFSPETQARFQAAMKLTEKNDRLQFVVCLNYGGRADIVSACQKIASAVAAGNLQVEDINSSVFQNALQTAELPDPDLLIRTSGEQRISNFFLWEFAYTEFYFAEEYWPDFDEACFAKALAEFAKRQRRYGQTQ